MTNTEARAILHTLADGRDPATGTPFPPVSPYQQADTVRALHAALAALDGPPARKRPANPDRPQLGLKWTLEEEQRLRDAFTAQTPIPTIATAHGRTPGAITARLVRLGLIAAPDHSSFPPSSRQIAPMHPQEPNPANQEPSPKRPTATLHPPPSTATQTPPRNPKPDDDLPF